MSQVARFLTPNQLSDFTLSEVEHLIPVLAPVLTPIYAAMDSSDIQRNPYVWPLKPRTRLS